MAVSFLMCALQGIGYLAVAGSAVSGQATAIPLGALALQVVLAFLARNPHQSALNVATFGLLGRPDFRVDGTVAPGFEDVRSVFAHHFEQGLERCSQFVVYHEGKKVVDLWGSVRGQGVHNPKGGQDYDGDTMQVCWSSTKVMAALAINMLVDRGHLAYDDPVCKVWPEFAQNGKEGITVRDCLRHEAGVAFFSKEGLLEVSDVMDPAALSKRFEEAAPLGWEDDQHVHRCPDYKGTSKRGYHAITIGYLLSLICRKADPKHRNIHEFLREEVAAPLRVADSFYIGCLPSNLEARVAPLGLQSIWNLLGAIIAGKLGLKNPPEHKNELLSDSLLNIIAMPAANANTHLIRSFFTTIPLEPPLEAGECMPGGLVPDLQREALLTFNLRSLHRIEIPAANGLMSARAMARVAAAMSMGGAVDGVTLLSPEGSKRAHAGADQKYDTVLHHSTTFVQGGFCEYHEADRFIPEAEGFYGWGGIGGSVCSWDPKRRLAVAYATNGLLRLSMGYGFKDCRSAALLRTTLKCV